MGGEIGNDLFPYFSIRSGVSELHTGEKAEKVALISIFLFTIFIRLYDVFKLDDILPCASLGAEGFFSSSLWEVGFLRRPSSS